MPYGYMPNNYSTYTMPYQQPMPQQQQSFESRIAEIIPKRKAPKTEGVEKNAE